MVAVFLRRPIPSNQKGLVILRIAEFVLEPSTERLSFTVNFPPD